MVKVRYLPNQRALDSYYLRQSGGGVDDAYFQGPLYQRGHGLGGLFGRIFRAAVPVFRNTVAPMMKRAGKEVAKEALTTGVRVAGDMLEGESVGESLQRRLPTAANRMATKGVRSLEKMLSAQRPVRKRKSGHRVSLAKRARKSIKGSDLFA